MKNPLDDLIEWGGGNRNRTAIALGVSPQLVGQWCKQGYIPFNRAEFIYVRTVGKITVTDVKEYASKVRHHETSDK